MPADHVNGVQLKLADSRWDERWLEAHPADRALAEGLTAAGQNQRDPAAAAALAAQLEARAGHDVWDRLDAITCPTLVGYGNYDGIAPGRNSAAIASRIRGAELRGYEGGHLFLLQDQAALPEFEAFLQSANHSSPRPSPPGARHSAGMARTGPNGPAKLPVQISCAWLWTDSGHLGLLAGPRPVSLVEPSTISCGQGRPDQFGPQERVVLAGRDD